jgi:Uma2 family endonuclease
MSPEVIEHEPVVKHERVPDGVYSGEQRVVLHNVSWVTYEHVLRDHVGSSVPQFTFDRGDLEITSPSAEHERYSSQIAQFVASLASELDVELAAFGSTTFRREDIERGFEADACFYFKNVEQMLGKDELDMKIDPPPDLVIEVDITSQLLPKLPIFQQFGVPEVWRFRGGRLSILVLQDGRYREADRSALFPGLSAAAVSQLIAVGKRLGMTAWDKRVRAWAREYYGK